MPHTGDRAFASWELVTRTFEDGETVTLPAQWFGELTEADTLSPSDEELREWIEERTGERPAESVDRETLVQGFEWLISQEAELGQDPDNSEEIRSRVAAITG